jgi:hypothetical protein
MSRRIVSVLAVLALTACGGGGPPSAPQVFAPLNYSYLPPIMLKVSSVSVVNQYVPDPAAATLLGQAPEAPTQALSDMLNRRLVANGTPGTATATIEAASIEPVNGNYVGTMTVRIDVQSADGLRSGYTEASVTHSETAPDSDASPNDIQAALYGTTKQLMDAMNVQLQYQIQRNLGTWVSYSANAALPPVGAPSNGLGGGIQAVPLAAPLAAPGSGPLAGPLAGPGVPMGAAATPPPLGPPTAVPPAMPSLIPPGYPNAAPP